MSIGKPVHELTIGDIFSMTFRLYGAKFFLLFTPYLVGAAITGILSAAIYTAFPLPPTPSPGADLTTLLNWLGLFISRLIAIIILIGIVSLIVGTITSGIVTKYISDTLEKGNASLEESFRFTLSKLPSLIGAQLLTSIIVGIGLVLLVVPGMILAIMFSLVIPSIIIEQTRASESLGRSRKLVSHRWGKTFVLLLILGIILLVTSWIATTIATPFGPFSMLVSSLITSFISPIFPIGITLLYYSMRSREIPPPPPPPPTF